MNKHKSFWLCFIAISNRMKMKNNNIEQSRNAVVWRKVVGTAYERCECGRWWAALVLTQQMGDMVAGLVEFIWNETGCTEHNKHNNTLQILHTYRNSKNHVQ